METPFSLDFWSDQIANGLKAWALLLPLMILVFAAAFKIKSGTAETEMRRLRAYTEAVEPRLQLARDLNAEEANTLAGLRAEIDALRELIESKPNPRSKKRQSVVETKLKEVDASAVTLAMANSTTDHILNAEKLSIGGLEDKRNLGLVPRSNE